MKICPVCKARCFDDMKVCYGCLHRFSEDQEKGRSSEQEAKAEIDEGAGSDSPDRKDRRNQVQTITVPAVAVRKGALGLGDEGEREEVAFEEGETLVLKIEIPRTCRGISVSYR